LSIEAAAQEMCDMINDVLFSGKNFSKDEQDYFDKLFEMTLKEMNVLEAKP